MNTWREMISKAMNTKKDSFDNLVKVSPDDLDLDKTFDSGYGLPEGESFTLWTKARVYFPVCYDGAEWVGSVPRMPCDEITEHQGGG